MCIICVSQRGVQQPTPEQITNMFTRNPHGAGYMTARGGKVEIHKGFMVLDDLQRQLDREAFTEDDSVVYHFRISTQAGVTPAMTQPFPMTRKVSALEALDVTCNIGVAHNGIIQLTSNGHKRYSDTALFVGNYMPRLIHSGDDLHDPYTLRMLSELTHSRLAVMDATGHIALVGQYVYDNGLAFSNHTYEKFTFGNVKNFTSGRSFWYDGQKEVCP